MSRNSILEFSLFDFSSKALINDQRSGNDIRLATIDSELYLHKSKTDRRFLQIRVEYKASNCKFEVNRLAITEKHFAVLN